MHPLVGIRHIFTPASQVDYVRYKARSRVTKQGIHDVILEDRMAYLERGDGQRGYYQTRRLQSHEAFQALHLPQNSYRPDTI